jgi:hypothetical protein
VWVLLNIHFHMLFLDGVYVECPDGSLRFRWVKAPTSEEITKLGRATHGAVAEHSYLTADGFETGPMDQILGSSITYRIAVGPQQGRKVFTLQTLPACEG